MFARQKCRPFTLSGRTLSSQVPGLLAQARRFVAIGTISTAASIGLYGLLRSLIPAVVANLVAIAVTTLAGSELNRRLTFSGAPAHGRRMLTQNLLTWAWSGSSTSLGLLLVEAVVTSPTVRQESAMLLAVSVAGGIARFALLRWWVFRAARTRADSAAGES